MKRRIVCIAAAALAAAALSGCIPKKIVWSPDGRRAVVVANKRIYLCDENGNLSAPIVEDVADDTMTPVAWFPDSRRILVVRREEQVQQWPVVAAVMSDSVREAVVARAQQLRDDLAAHEGDWDDFTPTALQDLTGVQKDAAALYIREHVADTLAEHLNESWWSRIQRASVEIWSLQVFEVHEDRAEAGPQIVRAIDGILETRIAPDGAKVAYVSAALETSDQGELPAPPDEVPVLFVVSADGSTATKPVADYVAWFPDWSPDSRHLTFAQPNRPIKSDSDDLVLGTVSRRRVADEDGLLLDAFGGQVALAGILFSPVTKIRCLPDGQILFSAAEVHLPSTAPDMPQRLTLFLVDPRRRATVARAVPREAEMHPVVEGMSIALFEVSPDGTRVAMAHGDGRVAIFSLDIGHVRLVQAEKVQHKGWGPKLRTMPTWRSNDELCFAVPAGSKHGSPDRAEIVLWSEKQQRVLSKSWPADVAADLLDGTVESKQQAESDRAGAASPTSR